MTVSAQRLSPASLAQQLRWELGLGWGRVEPPEICNRLHIKYVEDDLGETGSEAGALLRGRTGRLAVVVNQHIRYEGRRRFTAAHELGHARVPWHQSSEFWCTAEDIETYRPSRIIEREANEFAAELLLPERVVRDRLKRRAPGIALVRELAEEYGTSLTATACKVIGAADEDYCALALVARYGVKWIVSSRSFAAKATLRLAKQPAHPDSIAADILAGKPAPEGQQRVSPQAWLTGWQDESLHEIAEEAIPFPELGMVLSLITLPEGGEEEEE